MRINPIILTNKISKISMGKRINVNIRYNFKYQVLLVLNSVEVLNLSFFGSF